jgi:hypothetical protein
MAKKVNSLHGMTVTTKFQAKRVDADFDYFPPGTNPKEHTIGLGCECHPFETMIATDDLLDGQRNSRGIVLTIQVRHQPFVKTWESKPDIRMPDYGDFLPGEKDAVSVMGRNQAMFNKHGAKPRGAE